MEGTALSTFAGPRCGGLADGAEAPQRAIGARSPAVPGAAPVAAAPANDDAATPRTPASNPIDAAAAFQLSWSRLESRIVALEAQIPALGRRVDALVEPDRGRQGFAIAAIAEEARRRLSLGESLLRHGEPERAAEVVRPLLDTAPALERAATVRPSPSGPSSSESRTETFRSLDLETRLLMGRIAARASRFREAECWLNPVGAPPGKQGSGPEPSCSSQTGTASGTEDRSAPRDGGAQTAPGPAPGDVGATSGSRPGPSAPPGDRAPLSGIGRAAETASPSGEGDLESVCRAAEDGSARTEPGAEHARLACLRAAALVELGDIALTGNRFAYADRLFKRAERMAPDALGRADALSGRGRSAFARGAPDEAQHFLAKALEEKPGDLRALVALAGLRRSKRDLTGAVDASNRALGIDPLDAPALTERAFLFFREGDVNGAATLLRDALKADPMYRRARSLYGSGLTDETYEEREAVDPRLAPPPGLEALEAIIDAAVARGDRVGALAAVEPSSRGSGPAPSPPSSTNIHRALRSGSALWMLGDTEGAVAEFRRALGIGPDYGLANSALAIALETLADREKETHETAATRRLARRSAEGAEIRLTAEQESALAQIFPNLSTLPARFVPLVRRAVSPVAVYLPVLAASGATHFVLPPGRRITDLPPLARVRGERTFDLRLWDDVRGIGGYDAASGAEDVDGSGRGKYNTLAHEFAHQVHGYALTDTQRKQIKALFDRAKPSGRTLDYYADSNEYEYFAQGVEAYVSLWKRVDQKETAIHTRDELRRKDPALLRYIEKLATTRDLAENFAAALVGRGDHLFGKGDYPGAERAYRSALERRPGYFEALVGLGGALRAQSRTDEAIAAHTRAIEAGKDRAAGLTGLAEDLLYSTGSWSPALEPLRQAEAAEPDVPDGPLALARALRAVGDLPGAAAAYREAIHRDANSAQAHAGLGDALLAAGEPVRAVVSFRRALEIDRSLAAARAEMGRALALTGDAAAAEREIALALETDRNDSTAHYERGCLLASREEPAGALEEWRQAAALDPSHVAARARIALALLGTEVDPREIDPGPPDALDGKTPLPTRIGSEAWNALRQGEGGRWPIDLIGPNGERLAASTPAWGPDPSSGETAADPARPLPSLLYDAKKDRFYALNVPDAESDALLLFAAGAFAEADSRPGSAGSLYLRAARLFPTLREAYQAALRTLKATSRDAEAGALESLRKERAAIPP